MRFREDVTHVGLPTNTFFSTSFDDIIGGISPEFIPKNTMTPFLRMTLKSISYLPGQSCQQRSPFLSLKISRVFANAIEYCMNAFSFGNF